MAYDHSRKIGNQGDVVKHSVLHNCVLHLLNQSGPEEIFRYADSHRGRASYILPERGEWKRGIGLISSKTNEARNALPRIQSYFQSSLVLEMKVGQQYSASSNIVFRCLRSYSRKLHFELFETDSHAYGDLARFYESWLSDVRLNNGDGYEGVGNLASASLVLIDPPSLEVERIASCIDKLKKKNASFICWTPRNSSSNGNKQESRAHKEFGERTDLGHQIAVKWAEPSGSSRHMFGCRLTVSNNLKDVADETTQELTTLLYGEGWRLLP